MTEQTRTIILHGPRCPNWVEPTTAEGWLALQLEWRTFEDGHRYRIGLCPACGGIVYEVSDHGTIEFGVNR